jgi:hypothetical protein
MQINRTLQIVDIPWLRMAARAEGAVDVPPVIATKLLAGGFVQNDMKRGRLIITARGRLALDRLT